MRLPPGPLRRLLISLVPLIAVVVVLVPFAFGDRDEPPAPAAVESTETASAPVVAQAPPSGAAGGGLRPRSVTLTLLGREALGGQGFHGDVWAHKGFAYVGTWGSSGQCPATGVKIVDITDPTLPRHVSTVASIPGTSQEDVVVRSIRTPAFTGDLLVVGIQGCGISGRGGMALYNVTDPRNPVEMGFFPTSSLGVHELDLVQQGDRALALLAVPYSESMSSFGDFRIVDVSDPRRPTQLSSWGVGAAMGVDIDGGIGCSRSIYDHSARANADGSRAYLSYWDAGVIVIDISQPSEPRMIGRLTYPPGEEGDTHSVAETENGRILLVADEDNVFAPPYGLRFRVQTPSGPREFHGCETLFSRRLDDTGVIDAQAVDGGPVCGNAAFPVDPRGKVAVIDDSGCALSTKLSRLAGAGALAVIVGMPGEPVSRTGAGRVDLPVVVVSNEDATAIRQAAGEGSVPVTMPTDQHWSGLRIWDIADLANPRQLSVFQTPDSVAFPPPTDGFYTVHNPQVVGDIAFASWYTDGLRVIDIADPANPRELASFVPPAERNAQRAIFPDQTLVWGVYVTGDLVLISDINSGLWVLRWQAQ